MIAAPQRLDITLEADSAFLARLRGIGMLHSDDVRRLFRIVGRPAHPDLIDDRFYPLELSPWLTWLIVEARRYIAAQEIPSSWMAL